MSKTESTMMKLNEKAPDFKLPDTSGNIISRHSLFPNRMLVVFMCNHCPFVKHIAPALAEFAHEYQKRGLKIVGINANDANAQPEDSFNNMKKEVTSRGYPFPYLYDETQEVAKAYRAACTPDIYLFNTDHLLVYRGQFDNTRPNKGVANGTSLRDATEKLFNGDPIDTPQKPSVGCNIKWKPGNEPDYFKNA